MPQLLPDTLKAAASGSGGGATSKSDWHRGLEGIICADHIQLDAEVGTQELSLVMTLSSHAVTFKTLLIQHFWLVSQFYVYLTM